MGLVLFALFLGIPLAEIALFVVIGGQIGVFATIAIVIFTAIAGAWLVRWQGLETLKKARVDIERNVMPTDAMSEGLAILVAGALLLTPGFLTDAIGFTLLIPPARRVIVSAIGSWLVSRVTVVEMGGSTYRGGTSGRGPGNRGPRNGRDDVIDVEAVEIDIDTDDDAGSGKPKGNGSSPWRSS